jgi:hypothetical protein
MIRYHQSSDFGEGSVEIGFAAGRHVVCKNKRVQRSKSSYRDPIAEQCVVAYYKRIEKRLPRRKTELLAIRLFVTRKSRKTAKLVVVKSPTMIVFRQLCRWETTVHFQCLCCKRVDYGQLCNDQLICYV